MFDRDTIITHIGWSAIRVWGERATTLLVFIILARILSPSELGALAYIMSTIAILQTIADGALSEWLVRMHDAPRDQELSIFCCQTIFGLLFATFMTLFGYWFGENLIGHQDAGAITAALSLAIPLSCMGSVPEALLRRDLRFERLAYRSFISVTIGGATGISLALAGFGLWSLVCKQLVEVTARLFTTFYFSEWRPAVKLKISEVIEPIRYAAGFISAWTFDTVSRNIDSLIVGTILGTTALGYYSIALRICQLMHELFNKAIFQVALQYFYKASHASDDLRMVYLQFLTSTTCFLVPCIAIVMGLAPTLVPFLFSIKWQPAWPVLQWLCMVPLGAMVMECNYCMFYASRRASSAVLLSISEMVMVILGTLAGSSFGLTAAAFGSASRVFLTAPLGFILTGRLTKLSWRDVVRILRPSILGGLAAFIISRGIVVYDPGLSPSIEILAGALSAATLVFGGIYLLSPESLDLRYLISWGTRPDGRSIGQDKSG